MDEADNYAWKYIAEVWCNMKGRYTHIVKDFTTYDASCQSDPVNGSYYNGYKASICSVGVMGAKYVQNGSVVTT